MYGYGCGGCLPPIAPLTIPGIYSDTLSYEDNLAQLMLKINVLIGQVNNLSENVNEYTDEQIKIIKKQLESEINKLKEELKATKLQIENELLNLDSKWEMQIEKIKSDLNLEIVKINSKLLELKNHIETELFKSEKRQEKYTDKKVGVETIKRESADLKLENKIDSIIKTFPKVYNAVLGVETDVQTTFNTFYKYLRELGILSVDYDNLELTAEDYDNLKLQAHEFDVYSGYIFSTDLNKVFSPFTGKKTELSKVLYDLVSKLRWNADTSSYFDVNTDTAKNMDGKGYTAKDFELSNIRGVNPNEKTLERRYVNTVTVWEKTETDTAQTSLNSEWILSNNNQYKEIHSFTFVVGRKGKMEEINILFDLRSGETDGFDLTDFAFNNEKQVAYIRHVKIGLSDIAKEPINGNSFYISDCTANSLSYTDLSHESYTANDNLVVYEIRVNYNTKNYNQL